MKDIQSVDNINKIHDSINTGIQKGNTKNSLTKGISSQIKNMYTTINPKNILCESPNTTDIQNSNSLKEETQALTKRMYNLQNIYKEELIDKPFNIDNKDFVKLTKKTEFFNVSHDPEKIIKAYKKNCSPNIDFLGLAELEYTYDFRNNVASCSPRGSGYTDAQAKSRFDQRLNKAYNKELNNNLSNTELLGISNKPNLDSRDQNNMFYKMNKVSNLMSFDRLNYKKMVPDDNSQYKLRHNLTHKAIELANQNPKFIKCMHNIKKLQSNSDLQSKEEIKENAETAHNIVANNYIDLYIHTTLSHLHKNNVDTLLQGETREIIKQQMRKKSTIEKAKHFLHISSNKTREYNKSVFKQHRLLDHIDPNLASGIQKRNMINPQIITTLKNNANVQKSSNEIPSNNLTRKNQLKR